METKNVKKSSLTDFADSTNAADGTKPAIINTAEFEERFKKAIEEMQQHQGETQEEQGFNYDTDFRPDEIEKIVMNGKPLGQSQEQEDSEIALKPGEKKEEKPQDKENSGIALQPTKNNERLKDKGHKDDKGDEDIIQFNTQEKEGR